MDYIAKRFLFRIQSATTGRYSRAPHSAVIYTELQRSPTTESFVTGPAIWTKVNRSNRLTNQYSIEFFIIENSILKYNINEFNVNYKYKI